MYIDEMYAFVSFILFLGYIVKCIHNYSEMHIFVNIYSNISKVIFCKQCIPIRFPIHRI